MNTIEQRKKELGNLYPEPTIDEQVLNRFWEEALKSYGNKPLHMVSQPETTPYPYMEVSKVTYHGYDDTPIHAWYITPAKSSADEKPRACIVTFRVIPETVDFRNGMPIG